MLILFLMVALVVAVAFVYVLLVRPILRRLMVLKQFWADTDAFETSLWQKAKQLFDGLKIKLLARLVWVPSLLVEFYDKVLPSLTGIDITPITAQLPPWASGLLPILGVVLIPIMIDWARTHSSSPQRPGA